MQIIHATFPSGEGEEAVKLLESSGIDKGIYKLIKSESGDLLIINSLPGNIDQLLDNLNNRFDFKQDQGRNLVIFSADAVIPRGKKKEKEVEFRASRESLITFAESKAEINGHYLLLVLFSGIIASLGLILDNTAVIVGAMIIAPVLGPILAITIGIVLADLRLVKKGIQAELVAVLVAVLVGAFFGFFIPNTGITNALRVRMYPTIADLLIALAAGGAGAYALIKGELESGLVGVMIAASLIPVMSTIGIGISLRYNGMILGASLLLIGNYLALLLANIIIFYFKGLKPQLWYKNRARKIVKKSLSFIVISVILLCIPLGILTVYQLYTEKPADIIREIIKENLIYTWDYQIEDIEIKGSLVNVYLYGGEALKEEMLLSIKEQIEEELDREFNINFRVIPLREFKL